MSASSISRCICRARLLQPLASWSRCSRMDLQGGRSPARINNMFLRGAASQVAPPLTLSSRQMHVTSSCASDVSDSEVRGEEELVPERLYSKINIKVKGADFRVLESYCRFVVTAGKTLGISIGGRLALPTRIQKFTVLKSVHIFKKHRVQYEVRTHMRLMQAKEITGTTADIFLEYIQRNLPEGVSMTVSQERLDTLPTLLIGEEEKPPTRSRGKKGKT